MTSTGAIDRLELAPLRSLDDFLLSKARFQVPDVANEERWFNRITSNLLYYQTNYFLAAAVIFGLVALAHPQHMCYGIIVVVSVATLATYAHNSRAEVQQFKRDHPTLFTLACAVLIYFVVHQLGVVVVFLLGVALPMAFIVLHSSLRLRNARNKLANATEAFGLAKKTPMAVVLRELGIEPDLKYLS